jgi:hypothetical protein
MPSSRKPAPLFTFGPIHVSAIAIGFHPFLAHSANNFGAAQSPHPHGNFDASP